MKSVYAIRIYELLKQYEKLKERKVTVMDLREYCGIEA
jgi:plasmid replication initiation protein